MRKLVKTVLSHSRILKPLKAFHDNQIIIFNYHRIKNNNLSTPFDDSVFGPDAKRFRQEMEWLKKETRILSEQELIETVYQKKKVKGICSLVTFDDGYRDNFDIAYPILRDLNIPAIFFIPTHPVSSRELGWWDIVAYFIKNTKTNKFIFQNIEYNTSDKKQLYKTIISQLKTSSPSAIKEILHQLSESLNVAFPAVSIQSEELMTWEQIKILSDNGMSIGSHSHDHSILSQQDADTLAAQLAISITILENKLDKKINSIAYPVGGYQHFNNETKSVSKDLGFKLGFSYLTGLNKADEVDPFNVKRMRILPEWENLDIPLAFPNIFLKETKH